MKKNYINDDEINLVDIFKIIFKGRLKILLITIISFLIGLAYSYQLPNNYLNSITLSSSDDFESFRLDKISKMIKKNSSNKNRFIDELLDYDEFLLTLKNMEKVKKNITNLPKEYQEIELFKYTKLLKITKSEEDPNNYEIDFIWDNTNEARMILQNTIDLTKINLEKTNYEALNKYLLFEKELTRNKDEVRLNYLLEQSLIAKELNIIDNQIDNVNLSQSSVQLSISTADIAYYLRGYKAIDKEIELIKNRDYQNFKFIEQQINIAMKNIKWVDYNIYLMETKSLKNTKLIKIISIILGLILGAFYVIISNAVQSQIPLKKKN
jgi:LPS O-antigen subunit length determinant protein (WzzB/FepE family)